MGQRKTWTRRWTVPLEDGPAGQSRVELDQLMLDLSAMLVQSGGGVVITARRIEVAPGEFVTGEVYAEFDAYSPGLNLDPPAEDNGEVESETKIGLEDLRDEIEVEVGDLEATEAADRGE